MKGRTKEGKGRELEADFPSSSQAMSDKLIKNLTKENSDMKKGLGVSLLHPSVSHSRSS